MDFGVVIFPGSNCDKDIIHVLENVMNQKVTEIWHKEKELKGLTTKDCIILPGGFSYGDYLRSGAIARFSPIMDAVIEHANNGGYVMGICNGFQILCESDLLPGTLMHNKDQRFVCKNVFIKPEGNSTALTAKLEDKGYQVPVAHAEGRYFADDATLQKLNDNNQILFKYCDENGNITDEFNFNGSAQSIAGICNENKNVFGMMPHPERASENILGNSDGRFLFESLLASAN